MDSLMEFAIRTDREARQLIKSINSHLYNRLYCLIKMKRGIKFMEREKSPIKDAYFVIFCKFLNFLTSKRMIQRYEFSKSSKLNISTTSL